MDVVPLAAGPAGKGTPGWTTYAAGLDESPECEIMCGGVNSKAASAAALWRQGHLLHFGFETAPEEMNAFGQGLLVNAIAYIARFTGDRPIAITESAFSAKKMVPPARSRIAQERPPSAALVDHWFAPGLEAPRAAAREGVEAWSSWWKAHAGFLAPDAGGRLDLDPDLVALGAGNGDPEFPERAIAALEAGGAPAERVLEALCRYVPCGPVDSHLKDAPAAWKPWYAKNRDALFFSDTGGYRWYVDLLARARGVKSSDLRGPARADRAR